MARPSPYNRSSSFRLWSSQFPSKPQDGTALDIEFNSIKLSLDQTQGNLALIQDADGKVKRGSIGRAQLDTSITLGVAPPALWQTATVYDADVSVVFSNLVLYLCLVDHTSGTFATDLAAGRWQVLADFSATAQIEDGSITTAKLADGAVTNAKLGSNAVSTAKILNAAITTDKIADNAVTAAKLSANAAAIANLLFPAGLGPLPWSRPTLPAGWDWADGGVLLANTAYPALRAAYIADGFPYGQDGSGNPKKPSMAGRVPAGKEATATLLTSAGSGVDGGTLGAVGGAQTVTLDVTMMPAHAHTFTGNPLPAHSHTAGGSVISGAGGTIGNGPDLAVAGVSISSVSAGTPSGTNSNTGGGGAHNNVQPTLVVNYIIKAH